MNNILKTHLDFEILEDFMASRPKEFPEGDIYDISLWYKYLSFLKSGTNLVLTNFDEENTSNIINQFVSGRGESSFSLIKEKTSFYKSKLPGRYGLQDTFFMNESDQQTQKSYRQNNPNFFGFISDHIEAFERLSLSKHRTILPVGRRKDSREFNSWDMLNDYLLPLSDCIIIDNYIFSVRNSVIAQNLEKILVQIDKSTTSKYNLLIITYRGKNGEIEMKDVKPILDQIVSKHALNAKVSIIVSSNIEHDRNIFMNYMRISALAGFNFYNTDGTPKVKSEICFLPYTDPENVSNAQVILEDVSKWVENIIQRDNPEEFSGSCKNSLLDGSR